MTMMTLTPDGGITIVSKDAVHGHELVHCAVGCSVKGVDLEHRTVDVVMSTNAIDRHEERVEQDWDLKAYTENPVVLWAHDARSLPLGRAENVRMEAGSLHGRIRFVSAKANPEAEKVLHQFAEGGLNAVSVGFIPHSIRFEKENDREIVVLSKNELVELSVTPTPANREALARRRAKALADRERTNTPSAQPGTQPEPGNRETAMSEDSKSLLAKVEELTAKNQDFAIKMSAAQGRADAAEKAQRDAETAQKAVDARAKELETERDAFKAQAETFGNERDAAMKKLAELEEKSIEQEVDALVGKKIKPTEKAVFVSLRKQDKKLFDEMLAQREPMRLEEQVVPNEKTNGKGSTGHLAAKLKGA